LRTVDFLPFGYALGGATALLSSHNRRIGDMVAGTVVAREKHEVGQRVLAINEAADAFLNSFNTPQATNSPAATMQASVAAPNSTSNFSATPTVFTPKLSDEERELLTSFLQRRDKLRPEPRARLAHSLSTRLSARLKMPTPTRDESEAFLMTLLLALHQQEQAPH
jgi:hypothetical protein